MKLNLSLLVALCLSFLFSISPVQAQVWVKIRPEHKVVVVKERPAAPSVGFVWVEPEWRWKEKEYVYVEGRWAKPKRGHTWVAGHWEEGALGFRWVPGHWAR